MARKSYDTVTEALADLKKLGFTIDFSILTDEECLVCHLTNTVLLPDEFEIEDFYRFEGDSDPGDGMIVYAISSKVKNLKGIVVNAYGIYANNESSAIVKKLNTHPHQVKEGSHPEGTCPICWGYQEYDGKVKELLEDKQIDVNNHKDSYMVIQDFMKQNIDGIALKEGVLTECPNCSKRSPGHTDDR